jgi:hypothetical protein
MATISSDLIKVNDELYRKQIAEINVEDEKSKQLINELETSLSTLNRTAVSYQKLKYTYLLPKTSLICTTFKVIRDGTSALYGFLYSKVDIDGSVEHLYMCLGGTFTSQDGEFRKRFVPYDRIENTKKHYQAQWELVEEMIVEQMNDEKIEFVSDVFFPAKQQEGIPLIEVNEFYEAINTSRAAVNLYVLCWLCDYHRIHLKYIENHIHPGYQYVIYDSAYLPIYEQVMKLTGTLEHYFNMIIRIESLTYVYDKYLALKPLATGQKLFPLTYKETVNIHDIESGIWREYYIAKKCSDIVLNLVSPSFSCLHDWFFIQNTHAGLFDNLPQHVKFQHSEMAKSLNDQLRKADKSAYNGSEDIDVKTPKSRKFKMVSNEIRSGINYAEANIILTDVCAVFVMEYTGRTLRDIPSLIQFGNVVSGLERTFAEPDLFAKYMFEILYGCYCLNTLSGSMHGDLHINNVTMFDMYRYTDLQIDNPTILYVIGDQSYIFPHIGVFSVIIDFSRSLIGDRNMIEDEFGAEYAENFFIGQRERALRVINRFFPELYERSAQALRVAVIEQFPLLFKIMTILDMYSVASGITNMIKSEAGFNPHPEVVGMVATILDACKRLFNSNIELLIRRELKDIEYPNLTLIKEHFSKYLVTDVTSEIAMTLCDVFIYHKELKYSFSSYEKYPEILKVEPILEVYKRHNKNPDPGYYKFLDFVKEGEENAVEELESRYKKEKLETETDWMFE